MVDASPRRGRSFRIVALVFVALLAVGLVAAFVVYKKYVAYEPTVAAHVPSSARAAVRVDLTHVMFYEPFRRSMFPLADRFAKGQSSRRERLEARGIRVNSDIREVLAVSGPGPGDWALVLGGRMPRGSTSSGVAAVLKEEGRELTEKEGVYTLAETGLAFAESADGAFALASSVNTLASVLPAGVSNPVLSSGSGGLLLRPGTISAAPAGVTATFRAGSVVEIRGRAELENSERAEADIRSLLGLLAGSDAAAMGAIRSAEFSKEASGLGFRVALPREAVLGIIEALAQRVPG
ncbi:MAG TPA: hypothetical protein VFQ35_18110 [Polyangiaceae bacterium]|nr:hypothetical protein [Polyangiaceae bacterium]